jgi:metallo-beta-lactamase family protein
MKLQFFGAVGTTTGSMHLLEANGHRVLLECGLFQGKRKEAFERNRNIPLDVTGLDACILSHAHIDHSGNLPSLVRAGFRGPIHATPATRDLCEIMLADSAHLQEQDVRYVNKKRARQGKNLFEPLYTPDDIPATMAAFVGLAYGERCEVVPGVELTFRDAGHILGSALVQLEVREDGARRRVMFTGDLGRKEMPVLRDPEVIREVDVLITESTYGNRVHAPGPDVKETLAGLCRDTSRLSSRLVIPSFSVGRTQALIYLLNELCSECACDRVPVFVDSPLSTKATLVHQRHPECYDEETQQLLAEGDNPFQFPSLTYTSSVEESKALNEMGGPVIIVSASGMCEGGRILHHLAHSIEDERNVVLIVGYQARNTLGRRLVEGVSPVRIHGDSYELRARVETINALSAHADRRELAEYFEAMGPAVERAFVVHGEDEAVAELAGSLRRMGAREVTEPEEGVVYEV